MKIIVTLLLSLVALFAHAQNELRFTNLFDASENEKVSCYRIPALVTATNGDLLLAIDERVPSCGDLKWSEDINIVMRRSMDHGVSWTDIETVIDYPLGHSASDPSMIVDEITEEIFLFFNYMDLNKEKDVYYLKVMKSADHGQTWTIPLDITSQITKPEWHSDFKFITSGRGIQTSEGILVHTLVNLNHGLHLFASDDHGKSWYLMDQALKPANESKVVELADGSWMVNCRVNPGGCRYIHTTTDEGKTWEAYADSSLVDPACNASIIRYTSIKNGDDKNRLLFANANSADSRENMCVKISYDEGKTWSEGKTIYTGGSAYSTLTKLKNGQIGLCFEKDDYRENVFVSFSLEWLTDGKDHL